MSCHVQASGAIELYFYGELEPAERESVSRHVSHCADCRLALEQMGVIQQALATRPDVSAPASGGWSPFMARLDAAVQAERAAAAVQRPSRQAYIGYLAMAALLALVTIGVVFVARSRHAFTGARDAAVEEAALAPVGRLASSPDQAVATIGAEHLERSKLVVLGLAAKDAQDAADWEYERELAAALLNDTRLYRMTAEQRGNARLAGVLRDLELVLLQTSLAEETGPESLEQIQRLIRKRDLVGKMDIVKTAGG